MDRKRISQVVRVRRLDGAIRQKRDDGGVKKTFTAFVHKADEGTLSPLTVEATILLAVSRSSSTSMLTGAIPTP
jgi:ParB family transcriptional regulator, chromosome partitioning protein